MASDRTSSRPRRRTIRQASTDISTTRRPSPTTTTTTNETNLPPAPDPPTLSLSSSPSNHQAPSTSPHPRTTQGQAYHVPPASTTTPARRSPSPIPTPPGAPRITPLSDSDIEDEDKELVGMDRGYLRLGPRPRMPRQPTTGHGSTTTDQLTDQENSTSKMDSQLDSAMQYIMASRNRAAPALPSPHVASRTERIEYPYNGSGQHYGRYYQGYHLAYHHHEYHPQQQDCRHARRRKQLQLQYPDGRVERRYLLR